MIRTDDGALLDYLEFIGGGQIEKVDGGWSICFDGGEIRTYPGPSLRDALKQALGDNLTERNKRFEGASDTAASVERVEKALGELKQAAGGGNGTKG